MKKYLAFLSAALLLVSLTACGGKTPTQESTSAASVSVTEQTTEDPTQPEAGRVSEKGNFYVYIPDGWCKMEYSSDDTRIRLFDTPSAPDIQDDTPEIEIQVSAQAGTADSVKSAVQDLLKQEGAKEGKAAKIDGESFSVVSYTNKTEKRTYTVYTGLGGGNLATITLKGVSADDADAAAVLGSISFK